MAKNDEWCDFCNDKLKSVSVTVRGKEFEICNHCKSLTIEDKPRIPTKPGISGTPLTK